MFTTPVGRFRLAALAEAASWVGLLVGMFFKYVVVHNDVGVAVFGRVHAVLFILYVVVALVTARALRWNLVTLFWALVASVPPLGTVLFERWATRKGKLAEPAPVTTPLDERAAA
ncbi:DUF3817 domain-containing protein [Actinoalloteichus spitiensis]|uniref:DUF3817 domain-containing protein n=1 Tax=Actinoalloteichus spitiensis TaxID=252394 RepID=UPI000367BE55|nr:DUF3817 domain-containing protein [Actinoalloteichus spitiensis]